MLSQDTFITKHHTLAIRNNEEENKTVTFMNAPLRQHTGGNQVILVGKWPIQGKIDEAIKHRSQ